MLWEAMQVLGVTEKPHFEAHHYEDPGQPEEWRMSAVLTVLDPSYGTWREVQTN